MDIYDHYFACWKGDPKITNSSRYLKSDQGTSLLALLVGLSIACIIMMSAFSVYYSVKKTYVKERIIVSNATVIRSVVQFLGDDIQASGYWGCRTGDDNYPVYRVFKPTYLRRDKRPVPYLPEDKRPVFGVGISLGNCLLKGMPESVCDRIKDNSDLIAIYNVPKKIVSLDKEMVTPAEPIKLKKNHGLTEQTLMLISDCRTAELFFATAVQLNQMSHGLKSTHNFAYFSKAYGLDAKLASVNNYVYYIGKPERSKKNKKNSYALYRYCFEKNTSIELVSGILDFKIEYGLTGKKGYLYLKAEQIKEEWRYIESVRIKLETEFTDKKDKYFEIEFAIRNRHRFNLGFDRTHGSNATWCGVNATEYHG